MEEVKNQIHDIILKQKKFFTTGETKKVIFRIENLKKLKKEILKNDKTLKEAGIGIGHIR